MLWATKNGAHQPELALSDFPAPEVPLKPFLPSDSHCSHPIARACSLLLVLCLTPGTSSGWCEAQLLLWQVLWPALPEQLIIQGSAVSRSDGSH